MAALLFMMPGMASVAAAEAVPSEDISKTGTEPSESKADEIQEAETEGNKEDKLEIGAGDTGEQEPDEGEPAEDVEEEPADTPKEDKKECICETLCTEDSIEWDCPLCSAEDADFSECKGEKKESTPDNDTVDEEENPEETEDDTEPEGTETENFSLCAHHKEHTAECGYVPASEDEREQRACMSAVSVL